MTTEDVGVLAGSHRHNKNRHSNHLIDTKGPQHHVIVSQNTLTGR